MRLVVALGLGLALIAAPPQLAADPACTRTTINVGEGPLGYRATGDVCDGKRQGAWKFTFLTGERMREGSYDRGLEQGTWKTFHREGGIQDEGQYVAGKPDGKWIRRARNGTKIEERSYVAGKRDGPLLRWTDDGKLVLVRSCSMGPCANVCKASKGRTCTTAGGAARAAPPTPRRSGTGAPGRSGSAP